MGSTSPSVFTGPSRVTGLMYSQTSSPLLVTSKKWPSVSEQMKVLPFVRRWPLEPMWLKKPWLFTEL